MFEKIKKILNRRICKSKRFALIDFVAGVGILLAIICIVCFSLVNFPAHNHFHAPVKKVNNEQIQYLYAYEFGVDPLGEFPADSALERICAAVENLKSKKSSGEVRIVFAKDSFCKIENLSSLQNLKNIDGDLLMLVLPNDERLLFFKNAPSQKLNALEKAADSSALKIKDFKINGETFSPILNGANSVGLPKKVFPSVVELVPEKQDVKISYELNGIISSKNPARLDFLKNGEYTLRIRLEDSKFVKFISIKFSVH